jgi:hypothetical protein
VFALVDVLGEAFAVVAGFYRDVIAVRRGSPGSVTALDRIPELRAWAQADMSDGALISEAERLISARAALLSNANFLLALQAALVDVAGLTQPREMSLGAM